MKHVSRDTNKELVYRTTLLFFLLCTLFLHSFSFFFLRSLSLSPHLFKLKMNLVFFLCQTQPNEMTNTYRIHHMADSLKQSNQTFNEVSIVMRQEFIVAISLNFCLCLFTHNELFISIFPECAQIDKSLFH